MSDAVVRHSVVDGVADVRLDRPERRNAFGDVDGPTLGRGQRVVLAWSTRAMELCATGRRVSGAEA